MIEKKLQAREDATYRWSATGRAEFPEVPVKVAFQKAEGYRRFYPLIHGGKTRVLIVRRLTNKTFPPDRVIP